MRDEMLRVRKVSNMRKRWGSTGCKVRWVVDSSLGREQKYFILMVEYIFAMSNWDFCSTMYHHSLKYLVISSVNSSIFRSIFLTLFQFFLGSSSSTRYIFSHNSVLLHTAVIPSCPNQCDLLSCILHLFPLIHSFSLR